jgi:uncharacterized protein YyaL (SSP411 family)
MHSTSETAGHTNRLAGETSPYLLQHAHNPVDWYPWGEQALTLARQQNKPILLSIGYSACHWCHVMAHESFEDAEVAAVMNRLFINIKVDREERPDLDQIYQSAHQMLTQRAGGWPLTMFLTPDGSPFYGGTYFPKSPRYGLPGFPELCERVVDAFTHKRSEIEAQNAEVRRALDERAPSAPATSVDFHDGPINAAVDLAQRSFDPRWGGFGRAPKFPHPTDLALLLDRRSERARQMAITTLKKMCEGGIYDQIGGGFARYSVDERWEIPHFEKMLYDNGPLLALYADAWAQTGDEDFRRVAGETVTWVQREMTAPDGAYFSSLDADSEGEEGKFYVWQREEVAALLGPQKSASHGDSLWSLAGRRWGFDGPPNFENHAWHPKIAGAIAADEVALLASARQQLFDARELRIHPGRDDKILTSWNALMIQGMARAARVFQRNDWLASAQAAADFLRREHWRDGRLQATSKDGRVHLDAYLDDHSFLLSALLELLQAEFRPADLDFAVALAEAMLERFEDPNAGGFYFTAHDHETLIHRPKTGHDNATPSGNGVAAWGLQRLGHLLGDSRYLVAAERTLSLYWPQLSHSAGGFSSLLLALEENLRPPPVIILRGPRDDLDNWVAELGTRVPGMVLSLPNGTAGQPAALAKPESDAVNAWVCQGVSCQLPIADLEHLKRVLQAESGR